MPLMGHTNKVNMMATMDEGTDNFQLIKESQNPQQYLKFLFSASNDCTVRKWDLENGV
jgi:WD40 repeat protein